MRRSSAPCVGADSCCGLQTQKRKVGQSLSALQLPKHTATPFQRKLPFWSAFLLIHPLLHPLTHARCPFRLRREKDYLRLHTHLYLQLLCQPSRRGLPRMWTLLLGVTLGHLACCRSEQLQGEVTMPSSIALLFEMSFFFFLCARRTCLCLNTWLLNIFMRIWGKLKEDFCSVRFVKKKEKKKRLDADTSDCACSTSARADPCLAVWDSCQTQRKCFFAVSVSNTR